MNRLPEPELMDDPAQAQAYAHADFSEPHQRFITLFSEEFPTLDLRGRVLDLGCGSADVTVRFARAFPHCQIAAVDGAESMLTHAQALIAQAGLQTRIQLVRQRLPASQLTPHRYDAIISNSLLHHLHDPGVLWETIKASARNGAAIFVLDLMRPARVDDAQALVLKYAQNEPDILKRDFFNSLRAAFSVDEICSQLLAARLEYLHVRAVSDRHVLISGIFQTDKHQGSSDPTPAR